MATSPKRSQTTQDLTNMPFAANSQKLVLAAVQAQAQVIRAAMSFQVEALQFLQRRCEMHVKFVDQLVESEQLDDAVEAFAGFVQDAATDYAEGANKVVTLGSKIASETVKRQEAA
jgi:hypothetical protein